ncbi:MAG: hypothetical protein V5A42_00610 [Halofilum sp. (in: g-proteobacteria)]
MRSGTDVTHGQRPCLAPGVAGVVPRADTGMNGPAGYRPPAFFCFQQINIAPHTRATEARW